MSPVSGTEPPAEPRPPVNEGAKLRLTRGIQSLDDPTCAVLETIVAGLAARFVEVIAPDTDIVTAEFAKNFRTRLQLHHATHEEVFEKKSFEFAFKAASVVSGKSAEMDANVTIAGYDVKVDGVRFSLKTEGGKRPSRKQIKISKLMEARWIRECQTGGDYLAKMAKVGIHFAQYDRVLILRSFQVKTPFVGVMYDLWEIPHELLKLVATIDATDFAARTMNGTTSVVVKSNGLPVYTLRLDGSVEKITLEKLQLTGCRKHASWTVESLVSAADTD